MAEQNRSKVQVWFPAVSDGFKQLVCVNTVSQDHFDPKDLFTPNPHSDRYRDTLRSVLVSSRHGLELDSERSRRITLGFSKHAATIVGDSFGPAVVLADKMTRYAKALKPSLPTLIATGKVEADGQISPFNSPDQKMDFAQKVSLVAAELKANVQGGVFLVSAQQDVTAEQAESLKNAGIRLERIGHIDEIFKQNWLWQFHPIPGTEKPPKSSWKWVAGAAVVAMAAVFVGTHQDDRSPVVIADAPELDCKAALLKTEDLLRCGGVQARYDLKPKFRESSTDVFSDWVPGITLKEKQQFRLDFTKLPNDSRHIYLLLLSEYPNNHTDVADLMPMPECSDNGCGPFEMDGGIQDDLYFVATDNPAPLIEKMHHLQNASNDAKERWEFELRKWLSYEPGVKSFVLR